MPDNSLWRKSKCQSGTEVEVLKYAMQNGLRLMADMNYTGEPGKCILKTGDIKIKGFKKLKSNNIP